VISGAFKNKSVHFVGVIIVSKASVVPNTLIDINLHLNSIHTTVDDHPENVSSSRKLVGNSYSLLLNETSPVFDQPMSPNYHITHH
jgi:hypothetical protein